MTEATRHGEQEPDAKPGTASQAPDSKPGTSAAEKADSQDKTKDKPDSGQNEDG